MRNTSTSLTIKNQVTVPLWVRKTLNIESKDDIVWMELEPGKISIISKKKTTENPVDELCGILKGKGLDNIDLVESLLEDRKKDQELAKRAL